LLRVNHTKYNTLTKYQKVRVYEKLTKSSLSQHPMLGKLLATPNHTKSKENAKLNSFLQDSLKISKM
jgi:hypothetical protein